jgi:O-antigen/teichoic acid export membrane protein
MGFFKTFVKDTIVYTLIQLLPAIAGFVLLKLNSNYLSKEEFQVYNLLFIATNLFIITSTAGFDNWLLRKYYDLDKINVKPQDFLSSTVLLVAGLCALQALIIFPFSKLFLDYFLGNALRHPYAQVLILFTIVFSAAVNRVIVVYFRIEKKVKLLFLVAVLQFILQIGVGYYLLKTLDIKLWATQLSKGISLFLPVVILLIYLGLKNRFVFKSILFKDSKGYILPVLLSGLLAWVIGQCDQFILNTYYANASAKADYSMAFSLTLIIEIVLNAILSFLAPDIISSLAGKNAKLIIKNQVHLFVLIGCWTIIGTFVFALLMLDFFIDPKYQHCLWIVGLIASTYVFKLLTSLDAIVLHYHLKAKELLYSLLISGLVSIVLNVLFSARLGVWSLIGTLLISKAIQTVYLYYKNKHQQLDYNHTKVFGLIIFLIITSILTALLIKVNFDNRYLYMSLLVVCNGIFSIILFKEQLLEVKTSILSKKS